jgi:hypothetical protein
MSKGLKTIEDDRVAGRPFPWFCPRCRRQEVWRETIAYQCQREYRGQPILIAVGNLAVPKCRNCGELVFDYLADEQLKQVYEAQTRALDNGDEADAVSPQGERQQQA